MLFLGMLIGVWIGVPVGILIIAMMGPRQAERLDPHAMQQFLIRQYPSAPGAHEAPGAGDAIEPRRRRA